MAFEQSAATARESIGQRRAGAVNAMQLGNARRNMSLNNVNMVTQAILGAIMNSRAMGVQERQHEASMGQRKEAMDFEREKFEAGGPQREADLQKTWAESAAIAAKSGLDRKEWEHRVDMDLAKLSLDEEEFTFMKERRMKEFDANMDVVDRKQSHVEAMDVEKLAQFERKHNLEEGSLAEVIRSATAREGLAADAQKETARHHKAMEGAAKEKLTWDKVQWYGDAPQREAAVKESDARTDYYLQQGQTEELKRDLMERETAIAQQARVDDSMSSAYDYLEKLESLYLGAEGRGAGAETGGLLGDGQEALTEYGVMAGKRRGIIEQVKAELADNAYAHAKTTPIDYARSRYAELAYMAQGEPEATATIEPKADFNGGVGAVNSGYGN